MNPLMRAFIRAHTWLYRKSGGTRAASMNGKPIVLLTTKGRKSGAERTVPVMCFEDGNDRIVVASMGGAPTHPAWFLNMQADPNVTVQQGSSVLRARAVVTEGAERERIWKKIITDAPQFAGYEKKTTRLIPVVRLVANG